MRALFRPPSWCARSATHPRRRTRWATWIWDTCSRGTGAPARLSDIDHDVLVLDRHLEGLGHVGAFSEAAAGFDRDLEVLDEDLGGITPGLAGLDVEFPAMPGAAENLAMARHPEFARFVGLDEAGDVASAERRPFVRAAI